LRCRCCYCERHAPAPSPTPPLSPSPASERQTMTKERQAIEAQRRAAARKTLPTFARSPFRRCLGGAEAGASAAWLVAERYLGRCRVAAEALAVWRASQRCLGTLHGPEHAHYSSAAARDAFLQFHQRHLAGPAAVACLRSASVFRHGEVRGCLPTGGIHAPSSGRSRP